MTSYSIPSETPTKNLLTRSTDNSQPEVDASDWESQMARLVGFEQEPPTVNVEAIEDSASLQPPLSEPEEVQTKQPLSSNPFAKLAVVGSATLAVVLLAGGFLSQMMNTGNQRPANDVVSPVAQPQPTNASRQQTLEQEIETLKTKLALAEQAQAVTAAQQNLRAARPVSQAEVKPTPQESRVRPRMIQPTTPPPVRTVYVPQIVTVERAVQQPTPQPPRPQNSLAALPPAANPEAQPSPPDPLDEWKRLAKLGSYGEVQVSENNQASANVVTSPPGMNNNAASQTINPNTNPAPQPQQQPSVVSQNQSQNPKSVKVGTSAKAVLATAIFGETTRSRNNDKDENQNVFVVKLKEPLKAANGEIALPANTELLTQVGAISEQGLLQMEVVKIISQDQNGNLTEKSLPTNAIIIRGTQGKPLVANKYPNSSGSIASMDAGLFVLGGIGKAAELFNRADTEYRCPPNGSNNNNDICALTTNNRRNIPAGILEGGLNSLVPQISQRNQQAIAQMSQQTNVWFMAAGKNVEIYVNQTMQF
ncbi:hypothetical protein I8751_00430 [Nostocaceae cyanobacterium CENA357]|uniref:Uncharacterized protein n=1 Tax=Atlanticothrix silvestris CENA357 TaxID=1725252 RepID=A0A8J7L3J4_9CYAN|nr:TrbI/VirB10 family protein [Atlanticothrix silvestris]MBH8550882.1 hypothetical protein [Atlanticothrix silvestris CENA357]